jgi:hypothetical protein
MYKHFVPFVEEVLSACKEHPKASVRTWIWGHLKNWHKGTSQVPLDAL